MVFLSLVRRIEKVYPIKNQRIVAMTFDDGPNAAAPNPDVQKINSGVTDSILSTLKYYDSKGTFNVIGTTENNYPDVVGEINTQNWLGKKYDHYPCFLKDHLGGVKNNFNIIKRMIEEGHEISNHTYKHILAGPCFSYRERRWHKSFKQLMEDVSDLHNLIENKFDYKIRLARPPHYIDNNSNFTIFDVYCLMGYNYLGSSFDGGGWKETCGNYDQDVQNMIDPIKKALDKDPDSLNGQIIFQKDGCNMSLQTPVVDALPEQLKILKDYNYQIVTVSEMIKLSPYRDVPGDDPCFDDIMALTNTGHAVCSHDNFFRPQEPATWGQLIAMLTPSDVFKNYYKDLFFKKDIFTKYLLLKYKNYIRDPKHPYKIAVLNFVYHGFESYVSQRKLNEIVTRDDFEKFLSKTNYNINWNNKDKIPKKRDFCGVLVQLISKGFLKRKNKNGNV